jgi:hypothetical protein
MAKEKSPRNVASKQQKPAAKEAPANNQVIPIDKI